ncbi:hypothetical protein CEV34_2701 [Brucella pseudogrignonensis]|uniref:Uncharacterized protein n=1 Tax=Brucella pseudogrignonensis TaxID=419475 RepID=A0A256GGF8_9HYPH|nr:hypothetical protein CEV34_2701 [Brucella pseudogrignonensis]
MLYLRGIVLSLLKLLLLSDLKRYLFVFFRLMLDVRGM